MKRVSLLSPASVGYVVEVAFAVVSVEAGGLIHEVSLDQVSVAVKVVVAYAHAHSAHLTAIGTERNAANQCLFAKGAVVVVHQQQRRR